MVADAAHHCSGPHAPIVNRTYILIMSLSCHQIWHLAAHRGASLLSDIHMPGAWDRLLGYTVLLARGEAERNLEDRSASWKRTGRNFSLRKTTETHQQQGVARAWVKTLENRCMKMATANRPADKYDKHLFCLEVEAKPVPAREVLDFDWRSWVF